MSDTSKTAERIADIIGAGLPTELAHKDATQILEEFIVIPRRDLPKVTNDGCWGDIKVGDRGVSFSKDATAELMRINVLENIAVWHHLESAEFAETLKTNNRNKRRDELASELFTPQGVRIYGHLSSGAKRAVDRIIELEYEAGS